VLVELIIEVCPSILLIANKFLLRFWDLKGNDFRHDQIGIKLLFINAKYK
jgi:hypothetical protein